MRILVLSTWFPYPLSQGSKIRAYHIIKALARRHEVTLVSFAEEGLNPAWLDHMRSICQRVEVVHHSPFVHNRIRSIVGWLSSMPSALYAGYSHEMEALVRQVADEWKPNLIFSLTVITAPYAMKIGGIPKVLDIDNVLSRYLHELYEIAHQPLKRLRAWIAWKKFYHFEKETFRQFDKCITVSEADRQRVSRAFAIPLEKLILAPNGVDLKTGPIPSAPVEPDSLVFNGSLTYDANRDSMQYFLQSIFPLIRQQVPNARLRITGKLDGTNLDWVPQDGSVQLTGYLEDVRPVVSGSCVCVVPLRLGAGTRLKILEAMALGTPVVSTSKGAEGLDVQPDVHLLTADTPEKFAEQTIAVLTRPELRNRLSNEAQQVVKACYDWEQIGESLCNHLPFRA